MSSHLDIYYVARVIVDGPKYSSIGIDYSSEGRGVSTSLSGAKNAVVRIRQ